MLAAIGYSLSLAAIIILAAMTYRKVDSIMAVLTELRREVTELKTVLASTKALLSGLSQAIKDAGTDQAELDAITAELDSEGNAMAAEVEANTPKSALPPV